jgi:DNA-binding transcriptional MerR regulator
MATYRDEAATAQKLHVSRRTLQRWRTIGGGPPFVRVGARRIIYSDEGIEAYAAQRTHMSRAAELAQQPAK